MKNRFLPGLTAACFTAVAAIFMGACNAGSSADLESFEGRASYAIGVNIGTSLKQDNVPLDMDAFIQGVSDVLEDREPQLTNEEVGEALRELTRNLQVARAQEMGEASQRNIDEGQAYLVENGQREGVTTTESGLQYEVITQGSGPTPSAADRVSVHYRGTLIDGTEFESSYERGEPATFPVNGVINGWIEALQLMPVGSKYRLVIPSDLAYGERGSGANIGPNATLIFEVELLEIVEQ
jgi:FKBP-type peptidyl-prolyl cis-trans isomerase